MTEMFHLSLEKFDHFLESVTKFGYQTIGPKLQDGAIIYGEVSKLSDFPIALQDQQEKGEYRLTQRNDQAVFGFSVGPYTWRRYFDPPKRKLWKIDKSSFEFDEELPSETKYALIGVKACELAALKIQDKVFKIGDHKDTSYSHLRDNALIIGVHCYSPAKTCFCPSMGSGPEFSDGSDILLTEILKPNHYFILETKTARGKKIVKDLGLLIEPTESRKIIAEQLETTKSKITRTLNTDGIKELLYQSSESSNWEEIAKTCVTCANCTLVCPTCFCSTVEDVVDLTGEHAERWKKWDSCFTADFSYIHGGVVRESTTSRYRQWMTHKLASWQDQFDSSGCVGCGRCIAWCPVGIDLTESVKLFEKERET